MIYSQGEPTLLVSRAFTNYIHPHTRPFGESSDQFLAAVLGLAGQLFKHLPHKKSVEFELAKLFLFKLLVSF